MEDLSKKKCVPCEGGIPSFNLSEIHKYLKKVDGWDVKKNENENFYLLKEFKFENFINAQNFVNKVGTIAETEGHHPDIWFGWGYAKIKIFTHAINGLAESDFILAAKKYSKEFKLNKKKAFIIDIGSNDGIALKAFLDMGYKNVLGVEPGKNLAKLANKNKIKTFNGFLEKKNLKKIKKNADLILASNVFAHSDKLKEMADCMLQLLGKNGTIIIEIQYLLNTLKDLTFDNIYHEHYNYWSLTSLVNFFNRFNAKIIKSERVDTHGGSLRIYIKKDKKAKVEKSVGLMLKEEERFGIKKLKTYKDFGTKVYKIRDNVRRNIRKLKDENKLVVGYGAPAKATTALNFFNISSEIDYIVEDNRLKHGKFIPGTKIPIVSKTKIKNSRNTILVLAWNFFEEIKNNNKKLSNNFINIKSLEGNNKN